MKSLTLTLALVAILALAGSARATFGLVGVAVAPPVVQVQAPVCPVGVVAAPAFVGVGHAGFVGVGSGVNVVVGRRGFVGGRRAVFVGDRRIGRRR